MPLQIVALGLGDMSDPDVFSLASSVIKSFTDNVLFPDPSPGLASATITLHTFKDALTAWGPVGNRGSAQQYRVMKDARKALEVVLNQLALYAENTVYGNRTALGTIAWPLKKINAPVGPLAQIQNLRQAFDKALPSGAVKLLWNRPEGIKRSGVKSYLVLHSLTPDPNTATQLAVTTKGSFIDLEAGNRPSNFYWVIPVGTAGEGHISDMTLGYATGPVIR